MRLTGDKTRVATGIRTAAPHVDGGTCPRCGKPVRDLWFEFIEPNEQTEIYFSRLGLACPYPDCGEPMRWDGKAQTLSDGAGLPVATVVPERMADRIRLEFPRQRNLDLRAGLVRMMEKKGMSGAYAQYLNRLPEGGELDAEPDA